MWIIIHINMVMLMMKTIQMTINEELLTQVDQVVKAEKSNRSAFIRQALENALRHYKIAELEQQHANAYLQQPVKAGDVDEWLEEQDWGDEWNEEK